MYHSIFVAVIYTYTSILTTTFVESMFDIFTIKIEFVSCYTIPNGPFSHSRSHIRVMQWSERLSLKDVLEV